MKGLDKWLTEPYDDGFDGWCGQIAEALPEDWWERNSDWFFDSEECNKLLSKAFNTDVDQAVFNPNK